MPTTTPKKSTRGSSRNATPVKKSEVEPMDVDDDFSISKRPLISFYGDDDVELVRDVARIKLPPKRGSSRRASVNPGLGAVKEVDSDEDDDDTIEALAMYGKYGRTMGNRGLVNAQKSTMVDATFGFSTPKKKGAMLERTAQILSETKKTPVSKALERLTPSKYNRTPPKSRSAPTTPTSAGKRDLTPLRRLKLTGDAPPTPQGVRRRVSKRIEKQVAQEVDDEDGDTSSEEGETSSDEDDDNDGVRPLKDVTPTKNTTIVAKASKSTPVKGTVETPTRKGRSRHGATDDNADTDDYFETNASAQRIATSDKTLGQLKTPRLSPEALKTILSGESLKYERDIGRMCSGHRSAFGKWAHLLHEGFSLVCYGLGSKKSLLNDFHASRLADKDCVVVNGFFPSLSAKHVLTSILVDILEHELPAGTPADQCELVRKLYTGARDHLYLIIHNIDGPMLRNAETQAIFAKLASHEKIHLVCSIDHINAPLLWDQDKVSKLNPIWYDATTFLPYTDETLNENSLMVRAGGGALALHSLMRVFESLTPNAKEIYLRIVRHQMEAVDELGATFYQGISFKDLYRQCRPAFLVNSDLTLRAQLTEYVDHKLIRSKKGVDGMEYLVIPLPNPTLGEFLEKINTP